MDKKWYEQTVHLTQFVIEQFYKKNISSIFPYFHKDVVWIGASDGRIVEGREMVCRTLSMLTDAPEYIVKNDRYKTICSDDTFCTVAGYYTEYTLEKNKEMVSSVYRFTFVWKREDLLPQILHMHISNPHPPVTQDVHFQGKNAEIYFFRPDEILYIEASNNDSVIHTLSGRRTICQPFIQIVPKLPGQFHRVHRSFIVNRNHVIQIRRYKLLMRDGSTLPIPEKKYAGVRRALLRDSMEG